MKSKKYVMIITSENKLYESGEKGLDYFAGHPWEGDLEGIIYGNTFDELFGDGHNEGLFQQTYETETGTRLSYGILDPDTPRTEIEEYEKDKELPPENENWKEFVGKIAKENGCEITVTSDVEQGTKDANILYTDIWVSMGEPASLWEQRIKELSPYQINAQVMENAADNAILMHCLPAFHDTHTTVAQEIEKKFGITEMEVTNEVFESEASKVFDEAENRMHAIKAIVLATLR